MKGKHSPCFKQVKTHFWARNTGDNKLVRQSERRITISIALFLKEISFLERVFQILHFWHLQGQTKQTPFFLKLNKAKEICTLILQSLYQERVQSGRERTSIVSAGRQVSRRARGDRDGCSNVDFEEDQAVAECWRVLAPQTLVKSPGR